MLAWISRLRQTWSRQEGSALALAASGQGVVSHPRFAFLRGSGRLKIAKADFAGKMGISLDEVIDISREN